jgi:hypothetical protein
VGFYHELSHAMTRKVVPSPIEIARLYAGLTGPFVFTFRFRAKMTLPIMHTGIVTMYVPPHGFVVAADGLRRDATREVISTSAQKIFPIVSKNSVLAYAWTGNTNLLFGDGRASINLIEESARIGGALTADTWDAYVRKFADAIYKKLRGVPVFLKEAEARVLLIGYFHGYPVRAQIFFKCPERFFKEPYLRELLEGELVQSDFLVFSGSDVILEQMKPYLTTIELESLQDAAELSRDYLQRCIDRQDQVEAEIRGTIGGHIHIAEITPEGFRWNVAPEPDALPPSQS